MLRLRTRSIIHLARPVLPLPLPGLVLVRLRAVGSMGSISPCCDMGCFDLILLEGVWRVRQGPQGMEREWPGPSAAGRLVVGANKVLACCLCPES